jgi:hypothetical protein
MFYTGRGEAFWTGRRARKTHLSGMSFSEVLAELPSLTVDQRQLLVRRALELDDHGLAPEDEAVVEKRLADHRRDPRSAVPLKVMERRVKSRFTK